MNLLERIESIIEEPLIARGYQTVRIQFSAANRKILQIMIERLDDKAVSVDDCATVSRLVSVLLDVQDPIKDPYILEVSSPGLERPLVKLRDYRRFCGQMVAVTTQEPVNGRKKFQGRLTSADENGIKIDLPPTSKEELSSVTLGLENIRAARLLIDFEGL